jgi:hypothetical protein
MDITGSGLHPIVVMLNLWVISPALINYSDMWLKLTE